MIETEEHRALRESIQHHTKPLLTEIEELKSMINILEKRCGSSENTLKSPEDFYDQNAKNTWWNASTDMIEIKSTDLWELMRNYRNI